MKIFERIRLLPVLILVGVLMLGLRLGNLGSAVAQQSPSPQRASIPAAPAPGPRAALQATMPPVQFAQAQSTQGAPAAEPPARTRAGSVQPDGERTFSPGELDALEDLAKRREEIDRREAELEQREAILQAAERRIQQQVDELKGLQTAVQSAIAKYDDQEQARRQSLVRMFQNMKPTEAARIFEQMELPILLELVEAMNERRAAPILAQMNPIRAQQITAELARRRQPGNQPASQIPARAG
ncbi:MAG: MotE family protein [Rhodospirillales bacterium]|jgi:flagellar motility protein MotE (MotC chaperone)